MNKKGTVLLFLLFASCSFNPYEAGEGEDFYYIENEGVTMPVWVKGNTNSSDYIVFLNGGPGGESVSWFAMPFYQDLMQEYRIVFYDQRGCGWAIGNSPDEDMNPELMSRDLDVIIDSVILKYSPSSLFLMGHSWGGLLGTVYLTNETRQGKIDGWIEMGGAHNWPLGIRLSIAWVTNYADSVLTNAASAEAEKSYWQSELNWYSQNPLSNWQTTFAKDWNRHYGNVNAAYGYYREENEALVIRVSEMMIEYMQIHYQLRVHPVWRWFTLDPPVWEFDATPNMGNITLPSLLLWGLHDGILPVDLATNAYELLGTPDSNKSVVILSNSGHAPNMEEPEACLNALTNFIQQYK